MKHESLVDADPIVFDAIQKEKSREHEKILLIASENYVSWPVLEALGIGFYQ